MKPSFATVTVGGKTYPVKEIHAITVDRITVNDLGVIWADLMSDSERGMIHARLRAFVRAGELELIYRRLPDDMATRRLAELLWLQGECFERSVRRIDQYYRGQS